MFAVTQKSPFLAALAVTVSLVVGCSSAPRKSPAEVKQIRILPVAPIDRLYTENKSIPVGVLWQAIADRVKSNDFNDRMSVTRDVLASRFTEALKRELNAQGFEASTLEGVPRPSKDPDNIDYDHLPSADPVLHVYFSEMGMLSSRFSLDYLPKVNVYAALIKPGDEDYIYQEAIRYGVDAGSQDETWSVPSDPRFRWPSFDALINMPEVVVQSYEAGVDALAARIAKNIQAKVGASTTAARSAPADTN